MLEAILIPRIRKCTPKSFPTPISQRAKTYWPFILNNVLLLFITRKNISCETMRHVIVYNVWYDYSISPNILPRQVLLYLIYHERVHCYCVSRVKVMGAERREAGAEAERERQPPGRRMCSPELYCVLRITQCSIHIVVYYKNAHNDFEYQRISNFLENSTTHITITTVNSKTFFGHI